MNFNNGNLNRNTKSTNQLNVRPVSAFLVNKMVTSEDIFEAYFNCRRGKRTTASAIAYEMKYEERLLNLKDRINDRTYVPTLSTCFVVTRPRYREVFASSFEDRIVHHYASLRLEPLFEKIFSDRTFNCRKGKGVLYGINVLKNDIIECSNNYTSDCYIMKLDLKGFFMSIDRLMLQEMIDDFIVRHYKGDDIEDLRFVCRVMILHEPEKCCVRRSPLSFWDNIPESKSLFTNGDGKGAAIGNIWAQLFANFLLNVLDWFVEKLGIRYHGRYVDDSYMIDKSKEKLLACIQPIRELLAGLGLSLNERKFYLQHYTKGVQFTGSIVKPYRTYCGKRTINNFKRAVARLNRSKNIEEVRGAVRGINSYLGLLRQHDEYNNRRKILGSIDSGMFKYVYIKGHHEVLALKSKYKRHGISLAS